MGRTGPLKRSFDNDDGIEFVCCRICGEHRRVLSGRHLSKHDVDRETYMQEYDLSPDELIAKDFRMIQSSRRGFYPHGKRDWIAAVRKLYKKDGQIFAGYLQDNHPHLYRQGVWIFGDWDKALRAAGFDPEKTRMRRLWDQKTIIKKIHAMRDRNLPLYANYVMKNHKSLFSGALRQFGSWSKALHAAGITKKQSPTKLYNSRLGILRELRDALERCSKDDIPQALRLQAALYFGSLAKRVFSADKRSTALARLEQAKNYHCPFSDAPVQRKFGLRENTA